MSVTLHTFTEMYVRTLDVADHLLAKGVEFAAANDVSEADMLEWRLADDMNPLAFQLAIVCNFPRSWLARAADLPVPDLVTSELDVAGFRAAIVDAKAYVRAITPAQLAGRDDVEIEVTLGNDFTQTHSIEKWITGFATTNIYFHLSMVYAILRHKGVQIGKLDLFPTGL
ncbi:MAG TPA: DUF1993 domain-containing protein [Pseudomonadales bacterium]|nr:DUF1993 domain-containing protein [Pseudomonadales bacterium]